jgi:nucleoside-diphosphate-sugar epimerase
MQPHWPVYVYGETKSLGEQAALATRTDRFEVSIIRPAMVYGARGASWTTLPVELARRGLPSLVGGGYGFSHPVYVENLIDAYLLAAECDEAVGEAFTISDGDVPWREFFGRYAAMMGKRARSIAAGGWAQRWLVAFGIAPAVDFASATGLHDGARLSTAKAQRCWVGHRFSLDEGLRYGSVAARGKVSQCTMHNS